MEKEHDSWYNVGALSQHQTKERGSSDDYYTRSKIGMQQEISGRF